jgi:ribonuclease BN (tRNA processing enzyme)
MAPFTLTILGSGTAAPNPGGANSGYLLREGNTAVVMDCGAGTAGRVALHIPVNRLQGVAISHLHPDHYFDLVALNYLLKFGEPRPRDLPPRVPLWVPPGGHEFLRQFGKLIGGSSEMLEEIFEICDYSGERQIVLGSLEFSFKPVQHYILSHAMRVRSEDGALLVFSSDVAPCPQLVDAARDADLFLCESALLDASQDDKNPKRRGHLTAAEAGATARDANARRLLITHYYSSEQADAHHLSTASAAFDGPVDLAREGQTYAVR